MASLLRVVLSAAALLMLILPPQAQAQGDDRCAVPDIRTDIRPGAGGPPTPVTVGLRLIDLTSIDDISQTMTGDYAVMQRWTDPRLEQLAGCEVALKDIWVPGIAFVNSGRLWTSRPEEAGIGPGGVVTYIQRYYGALATYHNLHDFPFDKQLFRISLVAIEYGEDDVVLIANERVTGRRDVLNISDWTVKEVSGVDRPGVRGRIRSPSFAPLT